MVRVSRGERAASADRSSGGLRSAGRDTPLPIRVHDIAGYRIRMELTKRRLGQAPADLGGAAEAGLRLPARPLGDEVEHLVAEMAAALLLQLTAVDHVLAVAPHCRPQFLDAVAPGGPRPDDPRPPIP